MTKNYLAIDPMKIQDLINTRVLIVGDIILDRYWNGTVDRMSPEGAFPVLKVIEIEDRLGGAANVANNIASIGAKAHLMGCIGDDNEGQVVSHLLQQSNIKHTLNRGPLSKTNLKIRPVAQKRQMIRLDFENKLCSPVNLTDFRNQLDHSDIVILSDYGKGVLESTEEIINLSNAENKPVLIDPKGNFEKYRNAFLISPNISEMRSQIGSWASEQELEDKVFSLIEKINLGAILLTRSEEGMTLFTKNTGAVSIRSEARDVFDVCGAGDTVLAILSLALGSNLSLVQAMSIANVAAGIVVGKFGTSTLTMKELVRALEQIS